jgi:hypothetical protein
MRAFLSAFRNSEITSRKDLRGRKTEARFEVPAGSDTEGPWETGDVVLGVLFGHEGHG